MKAQFTFFLNNIITQNLIFKELPKHSFDGIVKILRSHSCVCPKHQLPLRFPTDT